MESRKSILGLGICVALTYWAFDWTGRNVEVVTLHTSGGYNDYYPRLFIVDDPPAVWIRAERPDRLWLASLRSNPDVVVRRGDRDVAYRAEVWNGEGGHQRVDQLFRAKYGLIDRAAAWLWRRDAVPVRLEPIPPAPVPIDLN
jgi:hypothetical protein